MYMCAHALSWLNLLALALRGTLQGTRRARQARWPKALPRLMTWHPTTGVLHGQQCTAMAVGLLHLLRPPLTTPLKAQTHMNAMDDLTILPPARCVRSAVSQPPGHPVLDDPLLSKLMSRVADGSWEAAAAASGPAVGALASRCAGPGHAVAAYCVVAPATAI